MKNIIIAFMITLSSIGFSQKRTLKGRYYELSEPTKVEYRFNGSKFKYSARTDVVVFWGKGNYEIRNDSLLLYFDHFKNESIVEYKKAENGDTINDFQIKIIESKTKTGLIGAKIKFLKPDGTVVYEDYLNEQGKIEFNTSENIKNIVISYLGQADLILDVNSQFSKHQYRVLWNVSKNRVIDGEVWRYKITDIKRRSFVLEKNGQYFTYKKRYF